MSKGWAGALILAVFLGGFTIFAFVTRSTRGDDSDDSQPPKEITCRQDSSGQGNQDGLAVRVQEFLDENNEIYSDELKDLLGVPLQSECNITFKIYLSGNYMPDSNSDLDKDFDPETIHNHFVEKMPESQSIYRLIFKEFPGIQYISLVFIYDSEEKNKYLHRDKYLEDEL